MIESDIQSHLNAILKIKQNCQWVLHIQLLRNRHRHRLRLRRHGCDNYAENNAINLRIELRMRRERAFCRLQRDYSSANANLGE